MNYTTFISKLRFRARRKGTGIRKCNQECQYTAKERRIDLEKKNQTVDTEKTGLPCET